MNIYYIFGIGAFAFVSSLILTGFLIPLLKKAKAGQNIREEGPASHQVKAGTPSMGGLAIIGAIILAGIAVAVGRLRHLRPF
jgi:phospho-N-acetylmuramoyl-pentapeptide-transferase